MNVENASIAQEINIWSENTLVLHYFKTYDSFVLKHFEIQLKNLIKRYNDFWKQYAENT